MNYNKTGGFEVVHGLLDRVMQLLEVPWKKGSGGYYLQAVDGENEPEVRFLLNNIIF